MERSVKDRIITSWRGLRVCETSGDVGITSPERRGTTGDNNLDRSERRVNLEKRKNAAALHCFHQSDWDPEGQSANRIPLVDENESRYHGVLYMNIYE